LNKTTAKPAELPIARTTELITVRSADGREVFTFKDMAAGLQAREGTVRQAFSANSDKWESGETGVSEILTPSGTQEVRWFTARGAMRFCRHVKSGRSDALFTHLLDIWDAQRAVAPPLTRDDKIDLILGHLTDRTDTATRIATGADAKADEALAATREAAEKAAEYDPVRLRELFVRITTIEKEMAAIFVARGDRLNYKTYRNKLKTVNNDQPVSRFSTSMTVPALELVVKVAEELLVDERRNDLRLFKSKSV
jgi:hypothetical protein